MSKKTTLTPVYSPKQIFISAQNFGNSAKLLEHLSSQILSQHPGPSELPPFFQPSVVCMAFSVELFLKCLILVEKGNFQPTHKIQELYLKLPMTSQKAISDKFDEFIATSPTIRAMQAEYPNISSKLDDVLKVVNEAFVDWRYIFEGNAGSLYGLGELCEAIRGRIIEIKPDIVES